MTIHRSTGEWSLAVRQQAAVARLGQVGLRGVDLEVLLAEAMAAVADTISVRHVALFELLEAGTVMQGRAAVYEGLPVPREGIELLRIPTGRESMPGYAIDEGEVVIASDLMGDPRFHARAAEFGVAAGAAITAPIGWGDAYWGVLGAYDLDVREWTDDEVHFVQSIANTVGLAIQRQAIENELRESSLRLGLSLAAGGLGTISWDQETDEVLVGSSAADIFGLEPGTELLSGTALLGLVHPDDRSGFAARDGGTVRLMRVDSGQTRWIETRGQMVEERGRKPRWVGVVADITGRRAVDEQKAALLAAEQSARLDAEEVGARLRVLAEAGTRFSQSLDPDVILTRLCEMCTPLLADVCRVDLLDEHGNLTHAVTSHADPGLLAALRDLRPDCTDRYQGQHRVLWDEHEVAVRSTSVVLSDLDDGAYVRGARDTQHLTRLRALAPSHVVITPLIARQRTIGVLTLIDAHGSAGEPRHSARGRTEDDLALIEELASRAALAVDNGRLFESRNRVVRSLQAALLPPALPEIDGLELAASYSAAEDDIEIGGDFYDVIDVADRVWGVVIGDVCGRGPDAAALTGLMRHSVRTAVVRERWPSRVLAQTNAAVFSQIDDSRFCTAAYLRVEVPPDSGGHVRVASSSAGHPLPVVLRSDGTTELIGGAGLVIGVEPVVRLIDVELELRPGDAIVLYTDGVTEARRGSDQFGEGRLTAVLRDLAGRSAAEIAVGLEAAVARHRAGATDDVAIVVVRARPDAD